MSAVNRLHTEFIKSSMTKEAIPGQQLMGKGLSWLGGKLLNSGENAAARWGGLMTRQLGGAGENLAKSQVGRFEGIGAGRMNLGKTINGWGDRLLGGPMHGPAAPTGWMPEIGAMHGPAAPAFRPTMGPMHGPAAPPNFRGGATMRGEPSPQFGPAAPAFRPEMGPMHGPAAPPTMKGVGVVRGAGTANIAPANQAATTGKPTGGFGGMMDYLRARPWMMTAGAGAGGAMLGNSYGHGSGYNDAVNQYRQNTSGFGGTLSQLGNAFGMVPTDNLFMPKYASHANRLSVLHKQGSAIEDFLKAACKSNVEAEEFYKQALMAGAKALGKSLVGGMAKPWGKVLTGAGESALRTGAQSAESAAARGAANAATAGSRWTSIGNRLQGWGKGLEDWAGKWHGQGNQHLDSMNGWAGSFARGTRGVGNLAGWGLHPSVMAATAPFAALDGAINRKDWTEDGARMGVAQSMAAAQNMNPMQRLAFLFAPGTVAQRGLSQAEQVLPGVTDQYNKITGGY